MKLEARAFEPEGVGAPGTGTAAPPPSTGDTLRRTAHGAGWIVAWRMVRRSLGLVNTLFLARLLIPADFGLVALGVGLSSSLDALSSLGVEDALVREAAVDPSIYDTGFTLNLLRSLGTAAILAAGAWPAARFFDDARLVPVILVLCACTILTGLVNIGTVDYRRNLDFRKEFILQSLPRLVAMAVTLTVALVWRSYWALLAGMLVNRVLGTALSYAMHPYRPALSLKRWRYLGGYSFWTWAIGVALAVRDRVAQFLIGHFLGIADVGAFTVGAEIAILPITEFTGPLGRACFSSFAVTRHNGGDASETFLRVVGFATLVSVPLTIGISAVADPIARILLGRHWLNAIPVIQVLGAFSLTSVFWLFSEVMLSAYGILTIMFRLSVVFAVVRAVALGVSVPMFGLTGAVYATAIASMIEHLVWFWVALRRFNTPVLAVLTRIWRVLIASGCMTLVLYFSGFGWVLEKGSLANLVADLALSVGVGAAAYAAPLFCLWLLSGRPKGAEADLSTLLKDTYRGKIGRRVAEKP